MFKIQKELLQATIDYLSRQKYIEVFQLLEALQKCEEVKKEDEKE